MFSRAWSTILAAGGVVAILSVAADARPVWKQLVPPPTQKRIAPPIPKGALDVAPHSAQEPPTQSVPAPAPLPEQPASDPAPPPVISITIEGNGSGEKAGVERDQSAEERDMRNLGAQQSMADSADSMVAIAWWQLWVGLLALVGLGTTVYYARKTTKAAIAATGAAVASAKTADDTFKISKLAMEAGDRAYVHHNGVRQTSHAEAGTGRIFLRLRPSWVNTGNTPTRQMRNFVAYELLDAPLPDDYRFPTPDLSSLPITGIPPKGSVEAGFRDYLGEEMVAVREGTKHLYIWGVTVYRDVFPDTPLRVTKFCLRATSGGMGDQLISEDSTGEINFVFHSRHNCADEDCA